MPDTGIPGNVGGYTSERVIHAEESGIFKNIRRIADVVEEKDLIGEILREDGSTVPVRASIGGILRGLLRDGYPVRKGFKIADIDPRKGELENCFTISDKARCIGGSVLELCVAAETKRQKKGLPAVRSGQENCQAGRWEYQEYGR